MHSDEGLRKLAAWVPKWDQLSVIQPQISALWVELKKLRIAEAEIRANLAVSCPLPLDALESRFWSKVQIIDDEDSCWEWTKSRGPLPDNYGKFRWVNPRTKKNEIISASSVALFLTTGAIPDHGCHTCDNPPCCRPKHVYDGTHADNMRDRRIRGRYGTGDQRGTKNPQAKLTDAQVIQARDWARLGTTLEVIHAELGRPCNQTVLRFAITGRTWKHLNVTSPPVLKR